MEREMIEEGKALTTPRAKVLVVEDNESVRRFLVQTLRVAAEYEIFEACDGMQAREILSKQAVDVVVTDLLMPRLGGMELMEWGRAGGLDVAWIVLTGRGTFEDAVRAVRLGAFDFLTKPLATPHVLMVAVRNALRERSLEMERRRLNRDLAERNRRLSKQVERLKDACRLLCEQAESLGEDMGRAQLIQRVLLPKVAPEMSGYFVNAVYRPSHKVAGDLYDVARLDERHVVFYVSDAAGHGVSAAMLAVLLKHRLALLDGSGKANMPAEALRTVNDSLLNECGAPGLFITAGYCLLDTYTGELTVASAGHPPILLQRRDGQVEMIYRTGPALGLSPGARFAQQRLTLLPGERVLLYTDGIYHRLEEESVFEVGALAELLSDDSLQGRDLLESLLEFASHRRGGQVQEDDITAVLLSTGEGVSSLDNGEIIDRRVVEPAALGRRGEVCIGSRDGETFFAFHGRMNWTLSSAFHEACLAELRGHHPVTLDFSTCVSLDSTFLGTFHELVARADRIGVPLRFQGILPQIRCQFNELGMERVVQHITVEIRPLPGKMVPLSEDTDPERNQLRVLHAHEALAALGERNRREFDRLIGYLREEVQRQRFV